MTTTLNPMAIGLDTVLHHLNRAVELLKEIQAEQDGAGPTHILENLAIYEAETESTAVRLDGLIGELRK